MKMYAATHRAIKRMAMRLFTAIVYTALAGLPASLPAQETESDIPPALTEELPAAGEYHDPAAAGEGEKQKDEEVVLPGAEIKAQKETAEHISHEQIIERGDTNLIEAIRWVPGIFTTVGHPGWDTAGFGVRGSGGTHDGDFMLLYVDGVPLHDGYMGRPDYKSVLVGGVESIDVAKGYNSILWGLNNMGGMVNVRSAKPKKIFEIEARTGFTFDSGGFGGNVDSVTAGTRLGIFYAKLGFEGSFIDHWRLPESYEPTDDKPPEDGGNPQKKGNRVGSEATSIGARAMLGVTPMEALDIWATYNFTYRDAGIAPPQAGSYNEIRTYGLNCWPVDTRHSAAFHAEWKPERFNITLNAYYDNSYTKGAGFSGNPSGRPNEERNKTLWEAYQNYLSNGIAHSASDTERYAAGGNLEGGFIINDWNNVAASAHFRQMSHIRHSISSPSDKPNSIDAGGVDHSDANKTQDWRENLYYGAAEWTTTPFAPFTAVLGLGVDYWQALERPWPGKTPQKVPDPDSGVHVAAGLFYDLTEQHELHLTYAKKHRYPIFYERTGAQVNETATTDANGLTTEALANPDLKPIKMHNFEFGYKGYFFDKIRITSAIYANYEFDRIARVFTYIDDNYRTSQYKNIEEFFYYGLEFGTEMFLSEYFTLGGALGVNRYKVIHSENDYEYMENIPRFTANGYIGITPFENINTGIFENIKITPRVEYVSMVDTDNAKQNDTREKIDDYALFHIKISAGIAKYFDVSFAINNLTDELYYTAATGYPMTTYPNPGRSFTISLGAKF